MWYVTMTDRFMSGWGNADRRINKLVVSCNTCDEAKTVAENAGRRDEMRYINITDRKPRYSASRYYVSWHGRAEGDYETWFENNAFGRAR